MLPLFDGGTETEFFPMWKREVDENQTNFTYNVANVNQKLGFSVIGNNSRYIMSKKAKIATV